MEHLLTVFRAYASTYTKPAPLTAMREKVKAVNGRSVIILSCSDPRVVPADFLGVKTDGMWSETSCVLYITSVAISRRFCFTAMQWRRD
jgi:hypothetical protein